MTQSHRITITERMADAIYDLANLNGITADEVVKRIFKLGFVAGYGTPFYVLEDGVMCQVEVFEKTLSDDVVRGEA